jgi:octaprenyl-diphosphate synthase
LELNDSEFASYFKSKTLNYHSRIEHAVSDVLGRFSNSVFYEPLNYAMAGGKRIRPLIVLLSYDSVASGNLITDNPMPAAIAVELLHTESIIHDDIIDKDEMRREKSAFHQKFGVNPSILSADFVLGIVLDIASQYPDSRIGRELSKSVLRMSEGEFSEFNIEAEDRRLSVDEYISIVSNKTASLFQCSAKIGAMIGGGKQQSIESLADFGLNLGIAYQMQDDVLDWNQGGDSLKRALGNEQTVLQKMSYDFAFKAKDSLAFLHDSESKQRLEELAEFAVRRRF